jgi:hypothetical protein
MHGLTAGFWKMLFLLRSMAAQARGFLSFAAGQGLKQIVIGQSAKLLRSLAKVEERWAGKDSGFLFQAIERGEGKAVSAIELVEGVKYLGFELVVRAAALCCGLGLKLRRGIGAYNFVNSHRCLR